MRYLSAVLACGLLVVAAASASLASPKLGVEPQAIDFKEIEQGASKSSEEVVLSNKGDEVLKILRVDSNCPGCIAASAVEPEIAPGKSTKLKIEFNAGRLDPSTLEKHIYLTTNDPDHDDKVVAVTVKATIVPVPKGQLKLQPLETDLGSVEVGKTATANVTMENVGSADLVFTSVEFDRPVLRLAEPLRQEPLKAGQADQLKIEFAPTVAGYVEARAFVLTNEGPTPKKVTIRAYAFEKPKGIRISEPVRDTQTSSGQPSQELTYTFNVENLTPLQADVTPVVGGVEDAKVSVPAQQSAPVKVKMKPTDDPYSVAFRVAFVRAAPPVPVEVKPPAEAGAKPAEPTPSTEEKPPTPPPLPEEEEPKPKEEGAKPGEEGASGTKQ